MFSLMGNCLSCSCVKKGRKPKRSVTLAVLGLDSAGKTTTTKALLGESVDASDTAPTIGFNKQEFTFENYDVTLYDLGGGRKIRDIWKDYLSEIYGIIYIIDSAAPERFAEVKESLQNLLSHEKVKEKPLLLLANKEDLCNHMDEVEIMEQIDLERLVNTNRCYSKMQLCSAIKGTGRKMDPNIKVAMTWLLCSIMDQLYEKLKIRVDADIEVMEQQRQREKEERRERVRIQREERQKREEEERKRLGIEKEDEEEEEDIVGGMDPFKRLDSDEIQRKEEKLKKAKAKEKERKLKLKELDEHDNSHKLPSLDANNHGSNRLHNDDDDEELVVPRSSRSLLGLSWLNGGVSNGYSPGRDGDGGYQPRSARHILPPLEGGVNTAGGSPRALSAPEKKRNKKGKNKLGVNNGVNSGYNPGGHGLARDGDVNPGRYGVARDGDVNPRRYGVARDGGDDEQDLDVEHYGYSNNFMSSVSRIQVEAVQEHDTSSADDMMGYSSSGGKRDRFRKSKGLYQQDDHDARDGDGVPSTTSPSKKKSVASRKKKQSVSEDDDGFDTLRLSQHFDEMDAFRQTFSPDMKPHISNGHISEERDDSPVRTTPRAADRNHLRNNNNTRLSNGSANHNGINHNGTGHISEKERSSTPVKKLKKKNRPLRKNKLAPSDDEYELSDVQNTPKKKSLPWATNHSPRKQSPEISNNHTNWGMAEDLSADESEPVRRTRPNLDSEDDPIL